MPNRDLVKTSEIRIIAGKHRSRKIQVLDLPDLRPSSDRTRETLFNCLQHKIIASRVLDAFCGSGALALEAISRGAESADCCEINKKALEIIHKNAQSLGELAKINLMNTDAFKLAIPKSPYDLIFLDPPFKLNLFLEALDKFSTDNWLKNTGIIYLETNKNINNILIEKQIKVLPNNLKLIKEKRIASVFFYLFEKN